MAKRRGSDHVPGNPLAEYLQKHTFYHLLGGAGGTVATEIQTGMRRPILPNSSERVGAWEIHAVSIRPECATGQSLPSAAASCWCSFQLLYGQTAVHLDESAGDFDDLIAGGTFHLDLGASGANSHFWPMFLDVVNPRPVFAEYLTFISVNPNAAGIINTPFTVSIWYAPIELDARQTELLLAMRARM